MKGDRTGPNPESGAPQAVTALPWFTVDELPTPPPEMRCAPEAEEEPTLFDDLDED